MSIDIDMRYTRCSPTTVRVSVYVEQVLLKCYSINPAREQTIEKMLDGLEEQGTYPRTLTPEEPRGGITGLSVTLSQIQDAVAQQLTLFPLTDGAFEDEKKEKLREVERYLAARFGASPFGNGRLRRAVMAQPGAPLPEWRVSWQAGDGP